MAMAASSPALKDDYYFDRGTFKEVMPLVINHHYAKRRCADPAAVFVMRSQDYRPVACCIFAAPANKFFGSKAIELVRLVRLPEYDAPLSAFIAKCLVELKREDRFFYCLAYADTDAHHHGGIYQACSFAYLGLSKGHTMYRTEPMPDLLGPRAARTVSARSRDQSTMETRSSMTPFRTGPKHLYIRGLTVPTSHILQRLGKTSLPYPKPAL
jgi:hypothetical protein